MAQHRITINHKEYTMPKIGADDYMDYLDASEAINGGTTAGYKSHACDPVGFRGDG